MAAGRRRGEPPRVALPVVVLAAVMAIGGIAYGVVQAIGGDDGGGGEPAPAIERTGSVALGDGPPVDVGPPPASYRVTYRVEIPGTKHRSERVVVQRPFGKRSDEGDDTEELTFGRRAYRRGGSVTVLAVPPESVDVRADVVIDDAVRLGLGERRERRRVLGRTCQILRFGVSAQAPGFVAVRKDGDLTEVCVGPDGIVLERIEYTEGRPFRRRVATRLEAPTAIAENELMNLPSEPTLAAANGGGSVRAVDPASEPQGRFFVLDEPPTAYRLLGRYSVVPPQGALANPETRNLAVASTDDVFVRDSDMIVVSRGGTLGQQAAFNRYPGSARLDLGPLLGEGEALVTLAGNEIRVPLPEGRYVRVYGTAPIEELTAIVRRLRETPGGSGLVFVD